MQLTILLRMPLTLGAGMASAEATALGAGAASSAAFLGGNAASTLSSIVSRAMLLKNLWVCSLSRNFPE
jgi:hypothetical protein